MRHALARAAVPAAIALFAALGAVVAQDGAPPAALDAAAAVVARVAPSVVRIDVTGGRPRGDLPRRHLFRQVAERDGGSGVVVAPDLVVTHAALADAASPTFTVITARGERADATLLHLDPRREVAVLRTGRPLAVPPAAFAAAALRPGELVLALGDPFGGARDAAAAVTHGVVEGVVRLEAAEVAWKEPVLLTSAAINPGSEGGALVDLEGRVVGLLAPLARDRRTGALTGHALPAEAVLAALAAARGQDGPRLGLTGGPDGDGRGLRVARVAEDGPAARAGVRPGDLLRRAGDVDVRGPADLRRALAAAAPGAPLRLVLEREGAEVVVDARPERGGSR